MDEAGLSLTEVMFTIGLAAMLLVLSAAGLRQFWLVRTLEGGTDEMTTRLRRMQEQAVSESHPLVFGVRFRPGSSTWALVRYDPDNAVTPCTAQDQVLDAGVFSAELSVSAASFPVTATDEETACRSLASSTPADRFVFFYSRGTATAGTVTLYQPALGRSENITITGITGRVDRS